MELISNFTLPPFCRMVWASHKAQIAWEHIVQRISQAFVDAELQSVASNIRRASLQRVNADQIVPISTKITNMGLSHTIVSQNNEQMVFIVARPQDIRVATDMYINDTTGFSSEMLGYPKCCVNFYNTWWNERGLNDLTWAQAGNNECELTPEQYNWKLVKILWPLGVKAAPHLACNYQCTESILLADRIGMCLPDDIYDMLEEMLNWPMEWSVLHGIIEVKTPIFKLYYNGPPTRKKHMVRFAGNRYPDVGASGLSFPYVMSTRPALTKTRAFISQYFLEEWYWQDNGFASSDAQAQAHRPIVQAVLTLVPKTIVDLGCGNGALLQKIVHTIPGIIPFGCDINKDAIEHAKLLMPKFGDNFAICDIINTPFSQYDMALISTARFAEMGQEKITRLCSNVLSRATHILLYKYADVSKTPDEVAQSLPMAMSHIISAKNSHTSFSVFRLA